MKKYAFYIILPFLIFQAMVSCKKQYDEGPRFSLSKPKTRLEDTWRVDKYKVDGIDYTQLYKDSCNCDFHVQYEHDDDDYWFLLDCVKKQNGLNWMFTFSFQNDRIIWKITTLNFYSIPPMSSHAYLEWKVKRLTSKDLIIETIIDNKTYRFEASS